MLKFLETFGGGSSTGGGRGGRGGGRGGAGGRPGILRRIALAGRGVTRTARAIFQRGQAGLRGGRTRGFNAGQRAR